jgi:hypothetical protein
MADGGVWGKVHPDYAGGGNGTLDPAVLLSDPVAVANATAPTSYTVKLTDGSMKKIWFLPGNTGGARGDAPHPEAIYSVELSQGTLNGVMVGSGGPGGGSSGNASLKTGGGGAGGVIGLGANFPVILPSEDPATYIITVGSTTPQPAQSYHVTSQSTSIAVQGQSPFAGAMGGGGGNGGRNAYNGVPSSGASGGGSGMDDGSMNSADMTGGAGFPGQGHKGGSTADGGGGGGYGGPPESDERNGGAGFDLASALMLDDSDGDTKSFIDMVTVDGWIAGGGATGGGTASAGGGVPDGGDGKDFTGAGGAGNQVVQSVVKFGGSGGAGMVLLVTEV